MTNLSFSYIYKSPTFADNIIFCKVNSIEWRRLLSLLEIYKNAFGQLLNKEKTTIFFGSNILMDV